MAEGFVEAKVGPGAALGLRWAADWYLAAAWWRCAMQVPALPRPATWRPAAPLHMLAGLLTHSPAAPHLQMLAKKFASLYYLLEDLLSPQKHYDWGLRAIKSVLVVAGSLLRAEAGQVRGGACQQPPLPPAASSSCTSRGESGRPLCCPSTPGPAPPHHPGLRPAAARWSRTCCTARCATSTSPRSWRRTWSSSPACSTTSSPVSGLLLAAAAAAAPSCASCLAS